MKISILTPTWNRSDYLPRVWGGLKSQTYKNFEWIIADDGSTDETMEVVRELAAKSDFEVTLIHSSIRVGKARIDNEAIRATLGDFILWCDSDDYLLPYALEKLVNAWYSIPDLLRKDYVGVTALCATNEGVIYNPFPDVEYFDTSWNDLAEAHNIKQDLIYFSRASALKLHPFPEVDFVVPESVVWTSIGYKKTRFIPEVLKFVEYRAKNAISFTGKMEYNRGRAHALATTTRNLSAYPHSIRLRIWRLLTFIRYCIHGEIGYQEALRIWGDNSFYFVFLMTIPIAYLLALKDSLQGKVVKSHRDFLVATGQAIITIERLNKCDKKN
jgi:glycosyltransferase involved in cell wall biosynthesis